MGCSKRITLYLSIMCSIKYPEKTVIEFTEWWIWLLVIRVSNSNGMSNLDYNFVSKDVLRTNIKK